jgi:hypothetical protein
VSRESTVRAAQFLQERYQGVNNDGDRRSADLDQGRAGYYCDLVRRDILRACARARTMWKLCESMPVSELRNALTTDSSAIRFCSFSSGCYQRKPLSHSPCPRTRVVSLSTKLPTRPASPFILNAVDVSRL